MMITFRNRFTVILLLIFIIPYLSGCSILSNNKNVNALEATYLKDSQIVNLSFSYGTVENEENVREIINHFTDRYPGIKVSIQTLPQSAEYQYNEYVTALTSGDDSFDIFAGDIAWVSEFATAGWIKALDGKLTEEEKQKYLESSISSCYVGDRLFALPWYTDTGVLFYRKDIVKTPPETWDELIDMVNANKMKTTYGYVYQGEQYEGLVCNVLECIWNNGGDILDGDNVVINSPQAVEGLQTLADFSKLGIVPSNADIYKEKDALNLFLNGNVLFMRNWISCYNLCDRERVGIAALPSGLKDNGDRNNGGTLSGVNLMINSNSRHYEEAWSLAQFISSPEMQAVNNIKGGLLPTRKEVYSDDRIKSAHPWVPDAMEYIEHSRLRPVFPFYTTMSNSMQINFYNALNGSITSKTAIGNIERDLKDILARFWIFDLTHLLKTNK